MSTTTPLPAPAAARDEEATGASPWRVVAIACAATFLAFLDVTVVNIAFPDLERDFSSASLSVLSWVVTAYGIVFAAALAPAGRIADVVGRRQAFLLGVAVFVAASAASAAAPTVEALIATRVVQGIGAATMIPAALGLILTAVPLERRSAAIGVWGGATSIAAALGPTLGGVLVEASDWRAVFLINLPIGLAVLWVAARELPRTAPLDRRLPDLPGAAVLTAALALVATALTQAGDWGWGDARTAGFAAAGAALLAAALARARSHPAPALHVSLWRTRNFAVANLTSLVFGAALFAWLLVCALFAVTVWHYSILEAGLAVSPGALTSAVTAVVAGRFVDRVGARPIVIAGALILALDGVYLGSQLTAEPRFLGLWLPTGAVSGVAFGAVSVGATSAAARALPPDGFAAGAGLNMTARQLGGALGVAAMASILSAAAPGIDGYQSVYYFCAGAAALTAVVGTLLAPLAARVPALQPAAGTAGAGR